MKRFATGQLVYFRPSPPLRIGGEQYIKPAIIISHPVDKLTAEVYDVEAGKVRVEFTGCLYATYQEAEES